MNSIKVVCGIFSRWYSLNQPEVLLFQRADDDVGGGLFEFPGGKLEDGESEVQALIRELGEELGISVEVGKFLGSSRFPGGPNKEFVLLAYFVSGDTNAIKLHEHQSMKWISRAQIDLEEMTIGDRPLMTACFDVIEAQGKP